MPDKLKCFVAMSFSHKQIAKLYEKSLKPSIRKAKLIPRCLIDLQHNDDLNQKIIREIQGAGLVIADLSYSRPSVYYEAGFAERSIPVIYTCLAEHLQSGNNVSEFKVHFDLQMKNIIAWHRPDDATFRRKLLGRLNLVSNPLKVDLRQREIELSRVHAFSVLSITKRSDRIFDAATHMLRKFRFSKSKATDVFERYSVGFKIGRKKSRVVTVFLTPNSSKSMLIRLSEAYNRRKWGVFKEMGIVASRRREQVIDEKLVICSLSKLPLTRAREVWRSADLGHQPNTLTSTEFGAAFDSYLDKKISDNVVREFELHVIDQIPHPEGFANKFALIFKPPLAANDA